MPRRVAPRSRRYPPTVTPSRLRFLPNSDATAAHCGVQAGGVGEAGQGATKTRPRASTAPTLADLNVLWGGFDQLLRVG